VRRRAFIAALFLPLGALGAEFNAVMPEQSGIAFVFKQMGVPMDGKFARFTTRISFDPAQAAKAMAQIDVDVNSIDAGSSEANDEVKGKNWFNAREFPVAKFVSSGVKALGGNRFEAQGKMSIKGRTREVVAPFSFRQEGALAVLEGSIPLQRVQYGIGEGAWSDTGTVADEVQVRFRFTLGAAKK